MTNPTEENNTILGASATTTKTTASASTNILGGTFGGGLNSTTATKTDGESGVAPDEDCSKDYEPVVRLAEIETKTGEEDEDVLFKIRSKLFRFSKELGEWKERGTGDVRILEHKVNHKIRLLMRREKTLKICLNHYVNPVIELKENVGSDRSWVWHSVDYADGEADHASLAIRFRDSDSAAKFKEHYDKAREHMAKLASSKSNNDTEKENGKDADEDKQEEQVEKKEDESKPDEEKKEEAA